MCLALFTVTNQADSCSQARCSPNIPIKVTDLPFFSVIIPTHNRLALLRQTLDCLAQQSYPPERYEVIVVDNGSVDGTSVYLHNLVQQNRIHAIRQAPLGPAIARNVGANAARGDIFAFTDDDCLPDPHWLAALAAVYQSDPTAMAVGGRVENVDIPHWLHHYYHIQDERQLHTCTSPPYLDTANASCRGTVFKQIGGFTERFHFPAAEDVEIGYRLTAAGYLLNLTPEALVWHQGRTTIRGILIQSWQRGVGQAMLMAEYPHHYFAEINPGWRSTLRYWLDRLVHCAYKTPRRIRPFLCAVAGTWRAVLYLPPQVIFRFRTLYARQAARTRDLTTTQSRRLVLLLLIAADNFLRLAGQVAGTYSYTYRQVQQNHEPHPLFQSHSATTNAR